MRYFIPGAFFFCYLFILILPQVEFSSLRLTIEQLVGIFGGIIVASPIVGYLIYASFDVVYGRIIQQNRKKRGALRYIARKTEIANYTKQKMFMFVLHRSSIDDEAKIKINFKDLLGILKTYLTNYTSRMVSGVFTPIFSVIAGVLLMFFGPAFLNIGVNFTCNWLAFGGGVTAIVAISAPIFAGAGRTLEEAYQLEEYLTRAKKREIPLLKELLDTGENQEDG